MTAGTRAAGRNPNRCHPLRNALHFVLDRLKEAEMAAPAERMKAMRQRRRVRGLRELRLVLPDARSLSVRRRVAKQAAGLDRDREDDALRRIEAVSEFDSFTKP